MKLALIVLLGAFACLAASQSSDAPPAGVTATQSLRTTWTSGSDTYYLYDITVTNGGQSTLGASCLLYLINFDQDASGSQASPSDNIRISQIWNMISYATAGGPPHSEFGPKPPFSLAPGQTDTSEGYVVVNSETTLTLLYNAEACHASSSSQESGSSAPSHSEEGSAHSSAGSSGSSSCGTLSLSQSQVNRWTGGSQWTVSMTNRGTSDVTSLDLVVAEAARIKQIWGVTDSGNGHYTFPSYTTSIAAGATFSFGYISTDENLDSFSLNGCSSSASSSQEASSAESSAASSQEASGSASASGSAAASSSDGSSSGCTASVDSPGSYESLNKWSDGTYNYIQYGLSVTNTGSSPLTSVTAFQYYSSSFGSISDKWNFDIDSVEASGATITINTFNLQPGQTFTGAGYVFKYLIANENDPKYEYSHYNYPYAIRFESAQC